MKFLIKIEEAINRFIERFLEKLNALTPEFVFVFIAFLVRLPAILKGKFQSYKSKVRIFFLKFIGYSQHYTNMIRGSVISIAMYLRSDEFKKADKITLLLKPIRYMKFHPVNAFIRLFTFIILAGATAIIFQNIGKIASGTLSLRKPASFESAEEDLYLEFKNHKFEVKITPVDGHGKPSGEAKEQELFLDLRIEASNFEDKQFLERMEEMLEDNIEALELPVTQLPLVAENQKLIEAGIIKSLNEDFRRIGRDHPIKSIQLKQVLRSRPVYYRQADRIISVTDINLQIFLEDTHRNRQVWLDFSVLASNRNIILYLKNHDVELKDHLTNNVEPVIPRFPVEDEGRLIIKDKMKLEVNQFLEKNGIEGKILEVYIDYLMAS